MREWRALNAIVELRRLAADVVTIADLVIYSGKDGEKAEIFLGGEISRTFHGGFSSTGKRRKRSGSGG
jgi:hypothetical protein